MILHYTDLWRYYTEIKTEFNDVKLRYIDFPLHAFEPENKSGKNDAGEKLTQAVLAIFQYFELLNVNTDASMSPLFATFYWAMHLCGHSEELAPFTDFHNATALYQLLLTFLSRKLERL